MLNVFGRTQLLIWPPFSRLAIANCHSKCIAYYLLVVVVAPLRQWLVNRSRNRQHSSTKEYLLSSLFAPVYIHVYGPINSLGLFASIVRCLLLFVSTGWVQSL